MRQEFSREVVFLACLRYTLTLQDDLSKYCSTSQDRLYSWSKLSCKIDSLRLSLLVITPVYCDRLKGMANHSMYHTRQHRIFMINDLLKTLALDY